MHCQDYLSRNFEIWDTNFILIHWLNFYWKVFLDSQNRLSTFELILLIIRSSNKKDKHLIALTEFGVKNGFEICKNHLRTMTWSWNKTYFRRLCSTFKLLSIDRTNCETKSKWPLRSNVDSTMPGRWFTMQINTNKFINELVDFLAAEWIQLLFDVNMLSQSRVSLTSRVING